MICGPIFLLRGRLLTYYVDANSRRGCGLFSLGVFLIALGLRAFFLPVYPQGTSQQEEHNSQFHGRSHITEPSPLFFPQPSTPPL